MACRWHTLRNRHHSLRLDLVTARWGASRHSIQEIRVTGDGPRGISSRSGTLGTCRPAWSGESLVGPFAMTLKPGSRGYLCLGADFQDPKWREAIVLDVEEKWMKCLVRCCLQEAENAGLSMVQKDDAVFCMVEAEFHHLVSGVPFEVMRLLASNGELMKLGGDALQSEGELTFASLSEAPKAAAKKTKKAVTSSSEEGSSEDGDMFQSLRKSWLGDGTGKGRPKRDGSTSPKQRSKSKRFALLEKKRSKSRCISRSRNSRCTVTSGHSKGGPTSRLDGLAACPGAGKEEARPRSSCTRQVKQFCGKQQLFRQLEPSCKQLERTSEGGRRLAESRAPHVRTASATCAPLCEGDGERTRSGRPPMESGRLQQEDILEEPKGTSAMPLSRRSHPRVSSASRTRKSSTSDGAHSAVDPPSQPGQWGLADCLDADPCGRPLPTPFFRRRCGSPSTRHLLSSLDERACQDDGQPEEKRRRKRRQRRSRGEKGGQGQKEERKGQRQQRGQGEGQDVGRQLSETAAADETAQAGFSQFSVIRSFEDSWGSFGRFWKLVKSSGYHSRRLGPESPLNLKGGSTISVSVGVAQLHG